MKYRMCLKTEFKKKKLFYSTTCGFPQIYRANSKQGMTSMFLLMNQGVFMDVGHVIGPTV